MTFKLKNKQRVIPSTRQTLDAKHHEMMLNFQREKNALNNLYENLDNIQNDLNKLNEINNNNVIINLEIQQKIWDLEDKKKDVENKIKKIETSDDAIKYMLDTSRILHTYYNYINNECTTSNNDMHTDINSTGNSIGDSNSTDTYDSGICSSSSSGTDESKSPTNVIVTDKQINKKIKGDTTSKKQNKINAANSINSSTSTAITYINTVEQSTVANSQSIANVAPPQQEVKKVRTVLDFFMNDKSSVKTDMETGKKHINIISTKPANIKNSANNANSANSGIELSIKKDNLNGNGNIGNGIADFNTYNSHNSVDNADSVGNVDSAGNVVNNTIKRKISKEILYEQYMINIDNNYIRSLNHDLEVQDFCKQCNIELLLCQNSGIQICSLCGYSEIVIVDSDKPSYKDPPKEMTSFCYKRINHLNEFLAQFQAKETTEIPEDIYQDILLEIKKERITNMATITPEKMREILRKIKRNDYYEHIPYIINQLNGNPAPVIAPEIEDVLRGMFKAIQIPFEKYCPDDRKNFLSYNYFMYKFFELLELDEYLSHFQLLKSRLKLYQHDQIWKNICSDLGWEFIPSL
jgi:hypothetical protein